MTLALGLASLGCLLMIGLRVLALGSLRYAFLAWNLFLAWIPYLLSLAIRRLAGAGGTGPAAGSAVRKGGCRPAIVLLGLAWLFFYPNAPYILTDFIHVLRGRWLGEARPPLVSQNALLWYDIVLSSAFAFVGHFIGLLSLLNLHLLIRGRFRRGWGGAFVAAAVGAGGYGIYLGRFERLNSWDVLRTPLRTLRVGLGNLLNLKAVAFSLCFALFILLTYLVVLALFQSAREAGRREA